MRENIETHDHTAWLERRGPRGNLREAVAVFDTEKDMQEAVDDLESHGFSNAAISRPQDMPAIEAAVGHKVKNIMELEDDVRVPRTSYIDPDSRSSGMMVTVLIPIYILLLVGVGIAASYGMGMAQSITMVVVMGMIGAFGGGYFALRFSRRITDRVMAEKAIGGFLLWVRTGSSDQEKRAMDILRKHHGHDVHMHGPAVAVN